MPCTTARMSRIESPCRKPNTGMLEQAAREVDGGRARAGGGDRRRLGERHGGGAALRASAREGGGGEVGGRPRVRVAAGGGAVADVAIVATRPGAPAGDRADLRGRGGGHVGDVRPRGASGVVVGGDAGRCRSGARAHAARRRSTRRRARCSATRRAAGTRTARRTTRPCETSIYVDSAARRSGVGGALYDALLARLDAGPLRLAVAGIALPNHASVALHRVARVRVGRRVQRGRREARARVGRASGSSGGWRIPRRRDSRGLRNAMRNCGLSPRPRRRPRAAASRAASLNRSRATVE